LEVLICGSNSIPDIDVSMCTYLIHLACGNNGISTLDVSKNLMLERLYFPNCNLKELDISNNTKLSIVNCRNNQITTLDISNCKLLCEMVKGSSPFKDDEGYYGWIIDRDQDGEKDGFLYVDENVKVLIDGKNYNISAKSDSVSSVALNKATATLTRSSKEKKPTLQLVATTAPAGAEVEWFSSDPQIATVDGNGLVTALDKGSVVITCKAKDNPGIKAECKITVSDKLITKIGLNQKKYTLKKGKTLVLKVKTLKPADALTQKFTWTTSNKKVATVDKNGKVKAKGKGTCTITCLAKDGSGKKATCKIIVK